MKIRGTQNIPLNRVAQVNSELCIARFHEKEVLRIWPKAFRIRVESLNNDVDNDWEMELLPENTTITFLMDGKD
jgi:hypothetical protein